VTSQDSFPTYLNPTLCFQKLSKSPVVLYLTGSSELSSGNTESSFSNVEINVFINTSNFRAQYSHIQYLLFEVNVVFIHLVSRGKS
jgi:hypothetical protein